MKPGPMHHSHLMEKEGTIMTRALWRGLGALVLSGAFLTLFAADATAQLDNVAITKHNLSVTSSGTDPTTGTSLVDYGEICVYCHTPHGGQTDAPLWNRNYSVAGYSMYSSSTIDMTYTNPGNPTGISLACLSCHDGTIGLDVIINPPNGGPAVPGTTPGTNTMPVGSFSLLDTDLRNDHPISIQYNPSLDTKFNTAASVTGAGGLRLFGVNDEVQCASCHNPHESAAAFAPFLRKQNTASALCLTCHIK